MMEHAKPIYINLLSREQKRYRPAPAAMAVALLLVVLGLAGGAIYFSMQGELLQLRAVNSELKAELSQYKGEQLGFQSYQDLHSKIVAKEQRVTKADQSQIRCVEIFKEIEQALPDGVVMAMIEINQEKVLMDGHAPDYQELAVFLSGLRKSAYLQNIVLASSNRDEENGGVGFKVEMRWEAGQE